MSAKIIYSIAALVVVIGGGITAYKLHEKRVNDTTPVERNNAASSSTSSQTSMNDQTQTTSSNLPAGCKDGSQKDANGRFKPAIDISNKTATLDTSMGKIQIQLYDKDAPKTVQNFVCLTDEGYFNNLTFHRVAHNFVIQSGDPTGTGSGGDSIFGGPFEDELYSDTPSYKQGYVAGTVAMANAGPNTNTSQFFILTADHTDLPHNYTIFGKVTSGMDVVKAIGAVPVTPELGPDDGAPVTPVIIKKATIN